MAVTPEAARKQAFREAADWLILLQEDPTDGELRRQFDAWHAASGLNAEAWHATQRTADVASAMTPAHADEWGPALLHRRATANRVERPMHERRRARRPIAVSAALLAIAACIAMLTMPSLLLRWQADQMTEVAEQRVLDLQDGSRVTLAPSSAIAVAFTPGERRVRLLAGQAFFEVRPDAVRPFRVEARTVEASVLGTSFDMRLDAHGVTVAVQEGVVQIGMQGRSFVERLKAGDLLRVASEGAIERTSEPPSLVAAWRSGQLLSHDRPLREAVDMLRRYYGGTIMVTDGALANRTVTGVYNLADPEEALRGIVQTHGGRVRHLTPWLLVVSGS